jgi:hypothetical protein
MDDPEGPEKYRNIKVKYWASFYSCHTEVPDIKIRNRDDPQKNLSLQNNSMKIEDSV